MSLPISKGIQHTIVNMVHSNGEAFYALRDEAYAEIEELERENIKLKQRELELLAVIEKAACICESLGMATNGMYERNHECAVAIRKYAMSIDSTALIELLKKTRNEALVSCAEWAKNYDLGTPDGHGIAKFIRNMLLTECSKECKHGTPFQYECEECATGEDEL